MHSPLIFLGFGGKHAPIPSSPVILEEDIEIWDLQGMGFDSFLDKIRTRIPSVHMEELKNYKLPPGAVRGIFGITEKRFAEATWGILIKSEYNYSHPDIEFLLNLYSKNFLYPLFITSEIGIQNKQTERNGVPLFNQGQSHDFQQKNFSEFFRNMRYAGQYAFIAPVEIVKWLDEDWRFATACILFLGLRTYDAGKSIIGWQREAADIGTLLECLLTADDSRDSIGYRLRKRAAVLLGDCFSDVEGTLKRLYGRRNEFVHGSFFAGLSKQVKKEETQLPLPEGADFELLKSGVELARLVFVACLLLQGAIRGGVLPGKKVWQVVEEAIIDIRTRTEIREIVDPVLAQIPRIRLSPPEQNKNNNSAQWS